MYHNGIWGTVCDDQYWDFNDSQVVCRQLGFSQAIGARSREYYGRGSSLVWLDNVKCVGTESTIEDCSHSGWGEVGCRFGSAGVRCYASNGTFSLNA